MVAKVIYLPEAYEFLRSIGNDARKKILYNIKKVRLGLNDASLFKKLKGTEIWEFPHAACRQLLSYVCFLGHTG